MKYPNPGPHVWSDSIVRCTRKISNGANFTATNVHFQKFFSDTSFQIICKIQNLIQYLKKKLV